MLIRGEVKDGTLQMNSKLKKALRDPTFQVCHVLSDRKSFFFSLCVDIKHSCQCHPVLWYKDKSFSQEGNLTPQCKQQDLQLLKCNKSDRVVIQTAGRKICGALVYQQTQMWDQRLRFCYCQWQLILRDPPDCGVGGGLFCRSISLWCTQMINQIGNRRDWLNSWHSLLCSVSRFCFVCVLVWGCALSFVGDILVGGVFDLNHN